MRRSRRFRDIVQNRLMPKIEPNVLIWARETAGLSIEEAARKLGLSGPDRLRALEGGLRQPTRRQLSNMSEKYRRPLLAFYLPRPPQKLDRGQDFRTLHEDQPAESEALVNALLRNVQVRQGLVRSALEEAEEDVPIPFIGTATIQDGVENLVKKIEQTLTFTARDFRRYNTVSDAFAALRDATEKAGVYVLLMGNLGTHHTDIDVDIFRGFALADDVAPFIVINENDARSAWAFTLLHELAHLWLGQTGISGYEGEAEIERFCDAVAARFLLNPNDLANIGYEEASNLEELKYLIGDFATETNLSRKMISYNLLRNGKIGRTEYLNLNKAFDVERLERNTERPKNESRPDYYVVRRHRVGPGLVGVVKRLVSGGALSATKAGQVLGVKPTAVSRLVGTRVA